MAHDLPWKSAKLDRRIRWALYFITNHHATEWNRRLEIIAAIQAQSSDPNWQVTWNTMLYWHKAVATPPRLPFRFLKPQMGLCACGAFFPITRVPARACTFEVRACSLFSTAGTRACNQQVGAETLIFVSSHVCLQPPRGGVNLNFC